MWMIFYYGPSGIFADIALILNIVLIFGILAGLGAVLTLPGIAGIVLTIGISVDANVLIFERVREELRKEKGLKQESDPKAIEELINKVIENNSDKVAEYKSGKDKLFGFFVGQAMKESKGKGNPQLINKILKEKLNG